ncbi:MAG: hypothetical protein AAB074_03005 [Planctomycetota bacterium]
MPLSVFRADKQVTSFLSALGSVRETRLTAALGFLCGRFPEALLPALGLRNHRQYQVRVEETDEGDRFDLLFDSERDPVVLEGKLGLRQRFDQLEDYVRSVRKKYGRRPGLVIVDDGSWHAQGLSDLSRTLARQVKWLKRRTWDDIAAACSRIRGLRSPAKADPVGYGIACDLLTHLEAEGMTKNESKEIYTRDVSDPESATMFFRHQIWTCQPRFLNSAQGNLYFAPYFTARAQWALKEITVVPFGEGISYLARIEQIQVVPMSDLRPFLRANGVDAYLRVSELVRRYMGGKETLVMLLGPPYLVFPAPVTKDQLSRAEIKNRFTAGTMGSRSLTLEELLAASRVTKFK